MIDFDMCITDLFGMPMIDELGGAGTVLTLARVAAHVLGNLHPDEGAVEAPEMLRRFMLAARIAGGGRHSLPAEDIALLKNRVRLFYSGRVATVIFGRVAQALDPACRDEVAA